MTPTKPEIIFEVSQDEVDGGYSASAVGYGIHTQGETLEEVRANVRDGASQGIDRPALVFGLHFVRDEVLAL